MNTASDLLTVQESSGKGPRVSIYPTAKQKEQPHSMWTAADMKQFHKILKHMKLQTHATDASGNWCQNMILPPREWSQMKLHIWNWCCHIKLIPHETEATRQPHETDAFWNWCYTNKPMSLETYATCWDMKVLRHQTKVTFSQLLLYDRKSLG